MQFNLRILQQERTVENLKKGRIQKLTKYVLVNY